ncbi:hypothetical protein P691DRAFT_765955 [Macrolepiota fuliginosa MF-IS2]|uniref:Uncharacterized protein n=1 Tax=Macrolepiota fuliginosa MF-IS2 TaxID=1400762 RepID=A0A9P6BXI1_9AGAR|nr:hypothetical protein P691DRAFT_765955 [Macrolepiota fuliginosa MF-IS2]
MAIGAPPSPFTELDAFYMLIMECIPPGILPTVLLLLSQVGGKSVAYISNILSFSEVMFKAVYNHLSTVVHLYSQDELPPLPNANVNQSFQSADHDVVFALYRLMQTTLGGSMGFYHKSFKDFLQDPSCLGPFHIESSAAQNALHK